MAIKISVPYAAAAIVMAGLAGTIAVAHWLTRPPRVTVGYVEGVEGGSPETQILKAFEARLKRDKRPPFALRSRAFADSGALRSAFVQNEIDIAPFATWEAVPDAAETVAILQRTRIVLVALDRDHGARRTKAEQVALVAQDEAAGKLGAIMVKGAFEGVKEDPVVMSPADAARALQTGRAEMVAIAAPGGAKLLRELIAALPTSAQRQVAVRAAPRADQLTRRNPAIESVELKIGSVSSDPLLPDDDIETLSVTTRLMAHRDVSENLVTDLTRVLLGMQRRLAQTTPAATQIEPPPTDRGSAFATHIGAAAYVDGEERTFLERYADWLYLVLFGGSALGSAGAAFASLRDAKQRRLDLKRLSDLQKLTSDIAMAASIEDVEEVTLRYAALMNHVVQAAALLQITQTDLVAFSIASGLFRDTRRERIQILSR